MITALCGGVGGSKLALGLYQHAVDGLSVIVNTADDLEYLGLRVCPDLDTVCYTLAGISAREQGWGIDGDTFESRAMFEKFGVPIWFTVGDRDVATHVFRTHALKTGMTLTEVTAHIAAALGIQARVLPMTEESVATRLLVEGEWIDFQEYFVHRRHQDEVTDVRYDRVAEAHATNDAVHAILNAEVVIVVNSNPVLSILPILATPGVRTALSSTKAKRVAVSPMVGNGAVSGPAGRLMRLIGHTADSTGVAMSYRDCIDGIVIDTTDRDQLATIEALGISVLATQTVMKTIEDRIRLAQETLAFARSL